MKYDIWDYYEYKEKFAEYIANPYNLYFISEKHKDMILVSLGKQSKFTKDDIEPPCVPSNDFERNGGTIVAFPDSITFSIYAVDNKLPIKFEGLKFKKAIIEYLKSKNINAYLDNNDILVDGYKVAGDMSCTLKENSRVQSYCIQISINVDLDIIRKYCDKEMVKTPAGLSQWGITREEILQVINDTIPIWHVKRNNVPKKMNLIKVKYENLMDYLKELKENPRDEYIILDKPKDSIVVSLSRDSKIKPEDVKPPCTAMVWDRTGGTIIGFRDNITVVHCCDTRKDLFDFKRMLDESIGTRRAVTEYLRFKGINAKLEGNDIIVDDTYKVCGCNFTPLTERWGLFGIHISLNVDLDIIKKYCDKEMVKIPRGLSDYGITREEIVNVLNNVAQ